MNTSAPNHDPRLALIRRLQYSIADGDVGEIEHCACELNAAAKSAASTVASRSELSIAVQATAKLLRSAASWIEIQRRILALETETDSNLTERA